MVNLFGNIAGLAAAAYIGKTRRKEDFDRTNQLRLKSGLPELPWEDTPIDKAFNWAGDKVKSLTDTEPAALTPTNQADTTVSSDPGGNVGLWERLKAGNIDQPGSEAYNRWGKGKQESDQRVTDFAESSRLDAQNAVTDAPVELPEPVAANSLLDKGAAEGKNSPDRSDYGFTKDDFINAPDASHTSDFPVGHEPTDGFMDKR